ncbi:hypothetical protein TNCV_3826631 [Trichonephila clavipes]|nr:hypothetical protein TNCV_3826631 [Trichonephila clavipes]
MEQSTLLNVDLWSGREKKKRKIGMARKRAENREGSLGFPGALCIVNGGFRDMALLGKEINKNLTRLAVSSIERLGNTRPLQWHSRLGSICVGKKNLHFGVPPPTTESNKGDSVPVIWQKTRHGTYLEYTQNIMLQHQGEDPTGKPDTPYLHH